LFNNAINTAAAAAPSESDFVNFDPTVFESIVRVNVLGGVLACKYAIPHMLAQGGGSILFTSSTCSLGGDLRQFSYGASKEVVNWYLKTIATIFGKQGIRCNGIAPGVIITPSMLAWADEGMLADFVQLQNVPRLAEPDHIAGLAAFLASDEATYMNGGL
jgi:NAD(P)-dependent dehydrogenase (short-subunit alcohol dehydrogenase family)